MLSETQEQPKFQICYVSDKKMLSFSNKNISPYGTAKVLASLILTFRPNTISPQYGLSIPYVSLSDTSLTLRLPLLHFQFLWVGKILLLQVMYTTVQRRNSDFTKAKLCQRISHWKWSVTMTF